MPNFHIRPELQPLFPLGRQMDHWLNSDSAGILLARGPAGRELRIIEAGEQVFFLKRTGRETLWRHLVMLFRGHRPKSGALREVQMLHLLKSSGFETMEPVAWGEQRLGLLTVRGFVLVRKVPGKELAGLFDESEGHMQFRLVREMGHLVGRLHARGFFHPVRLKDLIATNDGLVLIDRETSKPWKSRFFEWRCRSSLIRALRRMLRDGHPIGPGSVCAFLLGYRDGMSEHHKIQMRKFTAQIFADFRKTNLRQSAG